MDLFSSYQLGGFTLRNRMVMAPMTRSRAVSGNLPSPLAVAYYGQRADAGLIVTEATQVSPQGVGYLRTPGIHSPEQIQGWKAVTDAVHRAGGLMFAQLWHVGRISHPDFHGGDLPVAPSAVAAGGEVITPAGRKSMVAPRSLELGEMRGIVEQFQQGAVNAKAAGFDGVEIHGANGYLLDQFLRDGTNHRNDEYGGSVEGRARLPIEVAEAVASVWGPERVGYRVSPHSAFNSMFDSNPHATFTHLAKELSARRVAYLHVCEAIRGPMTVPVDRRLTPTLRSVFRGTLIVNDGYDAESGHAAISSGAADLVAYATAFLANPDLPRRFRKNARLNPPNPASFYVGEESGYIDYPSLEDAEAVTA